MKVMPSVLGQVGQNVANNLFEIGQSAVKGTAGVVADVASGSIEQIVSSPGQVTDQRTVDSKPATSDDQSATEKRRQAEKHRFEEVKTELARFIRWKQEQDQKIAEENAVQSQEADQKEIVKKKRESWVNKIINRSQTSTEKGRLQE